MEQVSCVLAMENIAHMLAEEECNGLIRSFGEPFEDGSGTRLNIGTYACLGLILNHRQGLILDESVYLIVNELPWGTLLKEREQFGHLHRQMIKQLSSIANRPSTLTLVFLLPNSLEVPSKHSTRTRPSGLDGAGRISWSTTDVIGGCYSFNG